MLYCLIIICICVCIYIYIYISVWVYQLETWDNVLFCLFWFHTLPSNHVYVTGSNIIYDIRKWVTIMNQYTIMIRHRYRSIYNYSEYFLKFQFLDISSHCNLLEYIYWSLLDWFLGSFQFRYISRCEKLHTLFVYSSWKIISFLVFYVFF